MIELNDISLIEYFNTENKTEYDFAFKYSKRFKQPVDVLKVGEFMELPFGWVKDVQFKFSKQYTFLNLFDDLEMLDKSKQFQKLSFLQASNQLYYFHDQIERINFIEQEKLCGGITNEELAAGIESLSIYETYPQLRAIAITFNTTPYQIRKWKYKDCFIELSYSKDLYIFEKKLSKIKQSGT